MKIGIIGAGIAGIGAAVRMAARGHEVEVFEANTYTGGKLSEFKIGDFRFDAGPSLFTMPKYVEELFALADKPMADYFAYEKLHTVCEYFWEDGTALTAYAEPDLFAQEVEQQLGVPKETVLDTLRISTMKYESTGKIFLEKSLHRWDTWFTKDTVKALVRIPQLDLFTSMNRANERLLQHPKLVQLFNRYATYNGSNPYKAPGLLNIIPHFEFSIGAFFPKNGMYAITQSLTQLAQDLGVQFHLATKVDEILVENKVAKGIVAKGQTHYFDCLINNMDIFHAYKKLLPNQPHPKRILNQPKSTSALIFYWGINRTFPELDLHNILFSNDYKQEFDYLDDGKVLDDPTVYINITSKYNTSDAPEGCENWFTMINVPSNQGQDWDTIIANAKANIIAKINRTLQVDITKHIVCEQVLEPRTIESKTWSHLGALYGTSSNNRMAAFMRHPNFSSKIKQLYFCGGSVHPGGGIPLALLSAKIIDDLIHSN